MNVKFRKAIRTEGTINFILENKPKDVPEQIIREEVKKIYDVLINGLHFGIVYEIPCSDRWYPRTWRVLGTQICSKTRKEAVDALFFQGGKGNKDEYLHIRISKELKTTIKKLAKDRFLSVSAFILMLIAAAVKDGDEIKRCKL